MMKSRKILPPTSKTTSLLFGAIGLALIDLLLIINLDYLIAKRRTVTEINEQVFMMVLFLLFVFLLIYWWNKPEQEEQRFYWYVISIVLSLPAVAALFISRNYFKSLFMSRYVFLSRTFFIQIVAYLICIFLPIIRLLYALYKIGDKTVRKRKEGPDC